MKPLSPLINREPDNDIFLTEGRREHDTFIRTDVLSLPHYFQTDTRMLSRFGEIKSPDPQIKTSSVCLSH